MKIKSIAFLISISLCISIPILAPPLASPAKADPMETLTITVTTNSCAAQGSNWHNLNLQQNDEIIQFTRPNLIVGSNPFGSIGTVEQPPMTSTVSGDLSGTMTSEYQNFEAWWDELPPDTQKGYMVGTFTFDDTRGNTFSGINVGKVDKTGTPPNDFTTSMNGYTIATSGTGGFAGQILVGAFTCTFSYDSASGCYTMILTMTLRRYSSSEISGPAAISSTGTSTDGNWRALGAHFDTQPTDEFLQFTRANIFVPLSEPVSYVEGINILGSTTGALTGTFTQVVNSIVIPGTSPAYQGWAAGSFTFTDVSGDTMKGFVVSDSLGYFSPNIGSSTGFMVIPQEMGSTGAYSGRDYYGTFTSTTDVSAIPYTFSTSANLYTLEALPSVATATGTGSATFSTSSGTIQNLTAISESSLPTEGKPDLEFPHGFFEFDITGLTAGETVTLTIELPSAVPEGSEYWKYGPTGGDPTPHWYQIAMGDNDGDKIITITLQDGDLGDDDLTANGVIVDQGGPGNPPVPPTPSGVPAFPGVYVGIAAAFVAALLAIGIRRKLVRQA